MSGQYILDEHGNPQPCDDLFEWGRWMAKTDDTRRVARTELANNVSVSTMFLGLDHNMSGSSTEPILWETMIFGGPHDMEQRRYSSREDAEAGHAEMVELAKTEEKDNE